MTSYGPWVQDDDFEASNEAIAEAGDEWRTEYASVDDVYGSVTPGTYTLLSLNRNLQPATEPYAPEPSLDSMKFAFQWIQAITTPEEPVDGRSAILNMREMYQVISASPYTEGAIFFGPQSVPDGVVGIQYEGYEPSFGIARAAATVVGATISGRVAADFHDSENVDQPEQLLPGDEFVCAVIADVGESWDSGTEPPEPSLFIDDDLIDHGVWDPTNAGGTIDEGDVAFRVAGPVEDDYTAGGQFIEADIPVNMLDAMGRALLYTKMDFGIEGPLGGPIAELPDPPGITGTKGYGYHLYDAGSPMTLTWTLRPPRYRFIFERGAAPPLRLFPRTDNLGNTPRLYPPPITRQRSNRATGYL